MRLAGVGAQRWESLAFVHRQVDPDLVQTWLPPGLTVDTYDGATWVGLVPFVMADVRLGPFAAVPGWSTFPELNLRVYVRDRTGTRGVWFLGLWCTRRLFVAGTRAAGVPYHHARAAVDAPAAGPWRYRFAATDGPEPFRVPHQPARRRPLRFDATVHADETVDATSGLVQWLTARWNAYAVRAGRLWRFPVEHEPWTLRRGSVGLWRTDALGRLGLPGDDPLVHVAAEPVHARFALPHAVG
ncbi:DUF2071 domain-containing protein [Cellulosimicrobium arenosum]|uniref:DUF2071 domain-containing protein n=1 Tax=Cellulosimicrobium arenosum TaxID=2708133 RepID=A0A927G9D8_9MICO|nr:DUF2071 domain-containing protein [Cellulosimicrobium arenosum]